MNVIKNIVIGLIVMGMGAVPCFAGLMEDLDSLTPTQAASFQQKLEKKALEGKIPANSGGSFYLQAIKPTQLKNAYPGIARMAHLYGGVFNLRYPVNESFFWGGNFGGAGNFFSDESAAKVYEDVMLGYGFGQLALEYRLLQSKSFILSTSAGLGLLAGGFNYVKTNDNSESYYNK